MSWADHWMYLAFVRRPDVRAWLDQNGIHLGNSDEVARQWLVVDGSTGEVYAAPRREAYLVLLKQRSPD